MLLMMDEFDRESIAAAEANPDERCLSIVAARCVCHQRLAVAVNHPHDSTEAEIADVARTIVQVRCHRGTPVIMPPLQYGPCLLDGGIAVVAARSLRRAAQRGAIAVGPVLCRPVETNVIDWRVTA